MAGWEPVVAVKDAVGDFARGVRIREMGYAVYSGDDVANLAWLAHGAVGFVSVAGHVVGDRLRSMHDAFHHGDPMAALDIFTGMLPAIDAIMGVPNYGATTAKASLEMIGVLENRRVRPPLIELDDAELASPPRRPRSVRSPRLSHAHPELGAPPELPEGGLRVIPLGGLGEVGRNMTVFEYDGRLLIVDCGVLFPDEHHPGVDLILPDFAPIRGRLDDVEALVLTHGHEDHIGATPYLLRERDDIPLVGSELTLALLNGKLREHRLKQPMFHTVKEGDRISFGPFDLEFVAVNHSIPDALAVAIRTGAGLVLHTGDFKMDQLPLDGRITDLRAFARLGEEGVDLFLTDSTNAEVPGFTTSEKKITPVLDQVFREADQRIIVACFASHVHRVQQILDTAVAHDRRVAFVGRSMVRNMGVARDLGYLTIPPGVMVEAKELADLPVDRQVLISTGSQGEPMSALARIANRSHHFVHLEAGDTVVLASSLIPGNENAVYRVINGLSRWGARVVHKGNALVHVSGHASAGELLYCYNIVRPRNVLPVHGEIRHMLANGALAKETGVENVVYAEDGVVVDLVDGVASVTGKVDCRLRVRRRHVDRRRHRVRAQGPPDPRRGGLHLGDRGRRLGRGEGLRRPRDPRPRPRLGRHDFEDDQAADHRRGQRTAGRRQRRHLPAAAVRTTHDRPLGQQHPQAPADDHPGRRRGLTPGPVACGRARSARTSTTPRSGGHDPRPPGGERGLVGLLRSVASQRRTTSMVKSVELRWKLLAPAVLRGQGVRRRPGRRGTP